MDFLLFHLARSYYNPPGDEVSCGNEVGCGEGRLKRRLRRIFKSLRLRRKVDTKEGIVVPDVIKEKKSEKKFSKFIKFFKRKSSGQVVVKEERKYSESSEDPPTCSTFSSQLQIVKSNVNVANQSPIKKMLYFVFGKCFGLIKSTPEAVVIVSAVQSFDNIDKVSAMEIEIEIKDDINEMETCDDNKKDASKNESKIDKIASPTGITMELDIPGHTTTEEHNTDSEKDAKWKSTEETHVDSGPVNSETLSEKILKLDINIPKYENESTDVIITDDSNDVDNTLDEIKADDEKGSKAYDDMLEETVPLFSDDDCDEEIEILFQQGTTSTRSPNLREQASAVPTKTILKVKLSPLLTTKFAGRQTPETPAPVEISETELTRGQKYKMSVRFDIPLHNESGSARGITPKPKEPSKELRQDRKSKSEIEFQQRQAAEKRLRLQQDRNRPSSARRERQKVKLINLEQLEIERKRALREHFRERDESVATRKGNLKNEQIEVRILFVLTHLAFLLIKF